MPHKYETEDFSLKDGTMLHTYMPSPDNIPALPHELALELRIFTAANDQKIPTHTRDLIRDLWDRYIVIEEALVKLLEENGR